MFLLSRPSSRDIDAFLRASSDLPLSYTPIGLAEHGQDGFRVDEQVAIVGSGESAYERAKRALVQWAHFELGWVELFPRRASIAAGTVVAVLVHHLGFWSLNGCRVVYSVGAPGAAEFGFAYGTLTNHAESGEEVFRVSLSPTTGEVTYLIRAVSRPQAPLAKVGFPVARSLQGRFRRDSTRALARALTEENSTW